MSLVTDDDMAKTKEDPRDDWKRKPIALQMRGSKAWKAWIEEVAAFNRMSVASLVDQAVAKHARDSGFPKTPPDR